MKSHRLQVLFLMSFTIQFLMSCSEPTKDKNGILLFENLTIEPKDSVKLLQGERYTGPIAKYFKDGSLQFKGAYKDGVKHGAWDYYHQDGELKREETAQPSQGAYEVRTYRSRSGRMLTELIGNGEDTIHYKKWHHNGKLGQELQHINGTRIFQKWTSFGNLYHYYNSDSIVITLNTKTREITHKGYFDKGKRTGRWFKYYKNGNKAYDRNYKSGILVGKSVEYFENGNMEAETNYNQNGELTGPYKKYHQGGKLFVKGQYDTRGEKTGEWTYYNADGKLWSIKNYRYDRLHGYYEDRNSDGKIIEKGEYKNDRKVGKWSYYDKFGNLEKEVNEGD